MNVTLEWNFADHDLAAIANHLGKSRVDAQDVRSFMERAMKEALGHAAVELEAFQNDPSASVGP